MTAFKILLARSGELANCSLVLFVEHVVEDRVWVTVVGQGVAGDNVPGHLGP
jgi:hypothetical protein